MDDETPITGQSAAPATTDTAPAQANETDVQTNNQAPEAPQDVKEPDVKATDTAEEKLYAGKYKSVEEMEKAYTSLQSKATKDSQEKAELTRLLNEAFTEPEPQAPVQTESFEEAPVNNETETIKRDLAVTQFIVTHPDADAKAMKEVLTTDPYINQIQGHAAKLEYALLRSQNMAQPKAIAEAQKQAANQATAKVVEKQAAQVESAKSSEKTDENSELFEQATGNYAQADRDAARRAWIRKNMVNL